MELHALQPSNTFARVIVVKVDEQSSEVEIEQLDLEDPLPSVDWEFSTRALRDRQAQEALLRKRRDDPAA
jgi:hypothetical protein